MFAVLGNKSREELLRVLVYFFLKVYLHFRIPTRRTTLQGRWVILPTKPVGPPERAADYLGYVLQRVVTVYTMPALCMN